MQKQNNNQKQEFTEQNIPQKIN